MSGSDETITDHKSIEGFTKNRSHYSVKAPWLVRKGAVGGADKKLNGSEDSTANS